MVIKTIAPTSLGRGVKIKKYRSDILNVKKVSYFVAAIEQPYPYPFKTSSQFSVPFLVSFLVSRP